MGLRTWIYEKTGIKLKKFDAIKNQNNQDTKSQRQSNIEPLLREIVHEISQLREQNKHLELQSWRNPKLIEKIAVREIEGCLDLIQENLGHAYLAPTDFEIRKYCINQIPKEGMILEFGVFQATSTNQIAQQLTQNSDSRTVYGFDSFEGLSHDGAGWVWEKGRFNAGGNLPKVEKNVELIKGWIDDTLPIYLKKHPDEKIAFIHVDVDIYEPAKTILSLCKDRLMPGSIILFDELIGYAGWRFNEYKALHEVFEESEFEYIAFSDYYQAAIKIL